MKDKPEDEDEEEFEADAWLAEMEAADEDEARIEAEE